MKRPEGYAAIQERKRKLLSAGMTAGLYALGLMTGIVLGIINPKEQDFSNMTVLLNLEGPIASEIGLGSTTPIEQLEPVKEPEPPAPAPVVATPEPVKAEPSPKKAAEAKPQPKTVPEQPPPVAAAKPTAPVPSETAPTVSPAPTPGPEPAVAVPAAPAEPWVPGERGPGSRTVSSVSSVNVPGQGSVPFGKGSSVTIRKAEKGNSSETTLGGAQGTVGHNIYVPVYYSFALPRTVPVEVYNAIPDLVVPPNTVLYSSLARKRAFGNYYEFDGSVYRLSKDVPLDQREPVWQILEDAGYDLAIGDYKAGKNLQPVVLGFTVTKDNQLKGVEILQSSGDAEMDRSVLYGFKRAAFWNKTGETVPGRFTYRF